MERAPLLLAFLSSSVVLGDKHLQQYGGGFGGNSDFGGGFGDDGGFGQGQYDSFGSPGAGDGLEENIPGTPGEDYPIYSEPPETSFTCDGQVDGGYYSDPEAECQAFHICSSDGGPGLSKYSFLCPNGTLFDQAYFVCNWWFNVDCSEAESLYSLNDEIAAARDAAGGDQGQYGGGAQQGRGGQQGQYQGSASSISNSYNSPSGGRRGGSGGGHKGGKQGGGRRSSASSGYSSPTGGRSSSANPGYSSPTSSAGSGYSSPARSAGGDYSSPPSSAATGYSPPADFSQGSSADSYAAPGGDYDYEYSDSADSNYGAPSADNYGAPAGDGYAAPDVSSLNNDSLGGYSSGSAVYEGRRGKGLSTPRRGRAGSRKGKKGFKGGRRQGRQGGSGAGKRQGRRGKSRRQGRAQRPRAGRRGTSRRANCLFGLC